MNWMPYALATVVALASADLLVKLAAGKLSNSVAMLLYGTCTFLFGVGWVLWQRAHNVTLHAQTSGIVAAVAVGVAFSFVTLGLYASFGAGAPISVASPLIRVGGLLLASLVGLLWLQEPFSWRYGLGMLLALSGIYLIITR